MSELREGPELYLAVDMIENEASADEETATSVVSTLLSAQLQALADRVAMANLPGNLEGLFAHYIIGNETPFPLTWDVDCAKEEWLDKHALDANHYPVLAAMGYSLRSASASAPPTFQSIFITGLQKLRRRNPLPEDRISFAYQPKAFLGLALGIVQLGDAGMEYRAWLGKILTDCLQNEFPFYHTLLYGCIRYELTGEALLISDIQKATEPLELALLAWGIQRGAFSLLRSKKDLSQLYKHTLHTASTVDVHLLDPSQAAVVWRALHTLLMRSIEEIMLSRNHVSLILQRFEAALRRWRWDSEPTMRNPIRWPITSEREVQDILWLILRSVFDDVVDEDTLPKLGHSTYRADFGLPSLRLLIEVKYVRQAADFKKIEKEVLEDAAAYLLHTQERYDRILVFIYDHSSSVQEYSVTKNALLLLPQIENVIIVSRPSQLP